MRILLVEDEGRIAEFVMHGLTEAGYAVDWAPTGEAALDTIQNSDFGLVILDLMLPGIGGLEVLERIRGRPVSPPVLVLSGLGQLDDRIRGLDRGADDYLPKPFALAELLARVRALLRRGAALPERIQAADLTLDCVRRRASRGGRIIELAPKEFSILEYLMRHQGRPLTRNEIVDYVWDSEFDGLTNIVDVYIRHLRAKIDDGSGLKLIRTVRGIGYMLYAADACVLDK